MKHKLLTMLGLSAMLFAGCMTDVEVGVPQQEIATDGLIAINISSSIDQVSTTRVNDNGFCDGDAIGIYVVNYEDGESGALQQSGNQVDNVKYVYDEPNNNWIADKDVYYRDNYTPVDIIGYYPYAKPSSVTAYPFEVSKDQSTVAANGALGGYEASDFLWAKAADITPTASRVNLKFQHCMSGIQVTLVEGSGWSDGEWDRVEKAVLVVNTKRKSTIDLATGAITAVGDVLATGIVPYSGDDNYRAVVVPQSVTAGTALLSLTVDGIPYGYKYKVDGAYSDFEYLSGKLHKFSVKVSKKSQGNVEFEELGMSITAWENDNTSHDAQAREYIIVNVPEANTKESALALAIAEAGYKYADIKNMKVVGYINNLDFEFMKNKMTKLQSLNLKEVTISANGSSHPANKIPNNAFFNKSALVRFVFPDNITVIGECAFEGSSLTGTLVLPNGVTEIRQRVFYDCSGLSGELILPSSLVRIGDNAFSRCSGLYGALEIPDSVIEIEGSAFSHCRGFTSLKLSDNLEKMGTFAFAYCDNMVGSLVIPDKITNIPSFCFYTCKFDGQLSLPSGLLTIDAQAFSGCKFRGGLKLPDSLLVIRVEAFAHNQFSGDLMFPKDLASIGEKAFLNCERLTGVVEIPNDIISLQGSVFEGCKQLEGVVLPRSMENIAGAAFKNCYQLNSITCKAQIPPTVASTAFNGVAKDNFAVEVPEASVMEYTTAPGWKEFKRIAAHRDFSISRNLFRTLNDSDSKTFVLRADADAEWRVEAPEWVTVTPSSGVGKTEVTITVDEMSASDVETFKVQTYNTNGGIVETSYNGRAGKVVFNLVGKDYSSTATVEQYDYIYGDKDVITNQTATIGNGVNIVFMGDCFDAQDIATGKYLNGINEAIEHFFAVEPYKSYKEYFNIYTVFGLSADSGVGSVNTIREAKFGSQYGLQASGSVGVDENICFEYACEAPTVTVDNICQTPIVLVENTYEYDGITYMWGDGSAIALCPMSQDIYPYDYRGIVQHEAGGHAFGKLGDEYIYHNAFIQTCKCICCDHVSEFNRMKSYGFYENLALTGNMYDVPWSHMIFDPQFSGTVDIYEGGFFHTRGVFRSESNSCMNNNVPYFSAISREAIVKRIMEYAGLMYSYDEFKANDIPLAVEEAQAMAATRSGVYTPYVLKGQSAPIFKGEKPNFRRNNK